MKKQAVITCIAIWLTSSAWAATPQKMAQFPEGERLVYTRLLEAFHKNQLNEVVRQRQILERNYPLSIHLDNAYYLTGQLQYQNDQLGEAIKSFDVVRDRYSKSNKRPSALFGMATTYQRLGLKPQAYRVFERIMKEYPGSPESQRAWMHLELEKRKGKPSLKR